MEFYDKLKVKKNASPETIKKAYYDQAKECHPDTHPGDLKKAAQFIELNKIHNVLSDQSRREYYDKTGDGETLHNLPAETIGMMTQMFNATIANNITHINDFDVVGNMKLTVEQALIVCDQNVKKHSKEILKLNEAKKKYMFKESEFLGTNLLENVFISKIQYYEREKAEAENKIKVLKEIKKMLTCFKTQFSRSAAIRNVMKHNFPDADINFSDSTVGGFSE